MLSRDSISFASCIPRDLKLENLLLENHQDSAAVKGAEFGFAKHTPTENLLTQCGSPLYVAPEIISKQPYGKPADMWAVGVITFILLGGYPPFQDDGKQSILFANIKAGNFQFDKEYWAHISEDAKNLISGLLQVNSSSRLTVYQTLAHPWVSASLCSEVIRLRLVCVAAF
jgi:calcium/calmodulin-dependent protein kinase I